MANRRKSPDHPPSKDSAAEGEAELDELVAETPPGVTIDVITDQGGQMHEATEDGPPYRYPPADAAAAPALCGAIHATGERCNMPPHLGLHNSGNITWGP